MYHQTYQQAHHAQDLHVYYHQRSQPPSANSVGSPAPVSTVNQLVLPSSSSIPVSASAVPAVAITPQQQHQHHQHHQQSYHYQQQPQPNMFHLNPTMQATTHQVNRDPTPAHLDHYFLMARAHQQQREQEQQQQQQHNYHVQKQQQAATTPDHNFVDVGSHQSPANTLSTLPPMAHSNGMLPSTANRRFEDIQLSQYQNMNNWQV
ncbi:hypothetical protein GGI23_004884 [Coemansia sp. RSA 2559]|nr:hypothetical protein GGI23_004884 [Coemansia sp. RSA 2559]